MSPEVRTQDILTAIATLRSSVIGRAKLWDFMRHHWDVLYERHCDDIGFLDYFVLLSIESFSTLERYQEVQAFFANKDTSAYDRILATCLEGIRMNILWLERDCKDVEQWLRDNGYLVGGDPYATRNESTGAGVKGFPATSGGSHSGINGNQAVDTAGTSSSSLSSGASSGTTSPSNNNNNNNNSNGLHYSQAVAGVYGQHSAQQQQEQQHVRPQVYLESGVVAQTSEEQVRQLLRLQQDQQQAHGLMPHEYLDHHYHQLHLQQQHGQQQIHSHSHDHSHSHFSSRPPPRPRTLEREMELLSMSGDYEF
ncbi:Aminopeptidase 2 mitochondrial [Modicella reniformis]|uniref:Aminopeptidase 2 mitochondrial n=1 Tax=Modicella reniformis TaxID=1440133 RepID=A0A9P6MJQ1_9FUNG|nr:Aminopeptidase 2 mitochondrial [Modicella reniformis]